MKEKILITGASGFVGSWLVEEALERGLEVYAGIRSSSSKQWLTDQRIKFLSLDLSDLDGLSETINQHQFQYVIHNAGLTKALKASDLFKVNAQYAKNLAIASKGEHLKKFVLMSSMAAYGTADYQASGVVSNTSTPHPITSYGKSKLRAERLLREISDLPLLIFRPTGIFGPRESDFLQLFQSIKKGLALSIGFTEQKLSLIYIKDLKRVIIDGTLSDHKNKAYFVSDGRIYPSTHFNKLIAKHLGKSPFHIRVPLPLVSVLATLSDMGAALNKKPNILSRDKLPEIKSRNLDCDISNLVSDMNFQPRYSLEEAIKETANWYIEQQWI